MYFLGAHSSEGSSAVDILYAIICVICFFFFVIPRAFSSSKKKKPQAKRPAPRQDFRRVVFEEPQEIEDDVRVLTEDFWRDNAPEVPQPAKKPAPANTERKRHPAKAFHVVPQTSVAPKATKKAPKIFATRKELRDAVLASEILGKPKALRTTPEPWEMF